MIYLTLCVTNTCATDKNPNPLSKERYQSIWDSLAHIEYQICAEKVEEDHKLYLKEVAEGSEAAAVRWTALRILARIALHEDNTKAAYAYLRRIPDDWLSHGEKFILMRLMVSESDE